MKQKDLRRSRTLSLDVRSNRIGYAVFEHETLLEAGITRFTTSCVATPRLIFLMRRFHPRVVVLRKISKTSSRNCLTARTILRAAERIAKRFSLRVAFVSEQQIRTRFAKESATTKYQIASLLIRIFSALAWRLPPPRKAWEGEHRNMAIFDAVALGMAYLSTKSKASKAAANDPEIQAEFCRRSLGDE